MEACSPQWQERLSAWFDGEVQAHERREVEDHLARCPGCSREASRYSALRRALKAEGAEEIDVPPALTARVARLAPPTSPRRRAWGRLAAALAAVGLVWASWPGGMDEALAMDLERNHLKAFSRRSPCEFESSDPAEVKAWVEREVGYAVEVPVVPGATLLGARRCRLHGRLSASLLYRHEGGKAMTLFLPLQGSDVARAAARFAGDGPRCTRGPVGERICVAPRGEAWASLAVSELEPAVLLAALARLSP
ncbi:zf-HC2 domain-containing protein [Myxococcus stipitatus]|uniref:anti-sigma factor family protein n=1 Tax=Myxococcus stipitatus TaxID=83455 RepID=UPI001F3A10D2|nr:zf-HC2 domain-containing protein [Myxococcus stipitatus]MCE9668198.1 zf-HC2 domain-containing protein [Myxococcus stipitatus]